MNNYEELKATEPEKGKDTIKAIYAPRVKTVEQPKQKITVFSIILSSVKNDNLRHEPPQEQPYTIPAPKNTVWCMIASAVMFALLLIMRSFADLAIVLPVAYFIFVFSVPLILIMFFYELNTRRNIKPFTLFTLFIAGVFVFAFTKHFCFNFLIKYVYSPYIDTILFPSINVIVSFVIIYIVCRMFKLKHTSEIILVAVSFTLGYSVSNSIIEGFSSMFILTELNITNYPLYVIIKESSDLGMSFKQFLDQSLYLYVYMPLLYSSIAVISATVISYNEQAKIVKKTMPKSSYLLLFLNYTILCLSVLDLNITYLNLIAKLTSLVIAGIISVNMLNNCLNKEIKGVSL